MIDPTNRQLAYETAAAYAVSALKDVDIERRCELLDVPYVQGKIHFTVLGKEILVTPGDFIAEYSDSGKPAHPVDRILALHYLKCDIPLAEKGELITFNGLQGGQFYLEPFRSRTVVLLEKNIGNNIELLRERLNRFKWEPVKPGDLGARIHAIGKIYITLVYRVGDEEFPPSAELLFDGIIKKVYSTDDVSALAGRLCVGLL